MAVVFAARTLAWAASRVSFAAIVRRRRPVAVDGDLAAVERVAERGRRVLLERFALARFVVLGRLAVLARFAGVCVVVCVVVVSQP